MTQQGGSTGLTPRHILRLTNQKRAPDWVQSLISTIASLLSLFVCVWLCVFDRLNKLEDTLATIAQLERSMQRLRQWLVEMEHVINKPLVFQHCDFVEIEQHICRQQVT